MKGIQIAAVLLASLLVLGGSQADFARRLLQTTPVSLGTPSTITVTAANPRVDAITITLARAYPQNAFYCNVTGDSRIPQQGVFPLTVRVPVGVTSTVVFANITGPIPGTSCTGSTVVQQQGGSSVVQQQGGSSVVQQQGGASVVQQQGGSSVVQQQGASSVVQQQAGGAVVMQQYAASINQQNTMAGSMSCVSNSTSVVQQQGSSVVQQQGSSSVVQQTTPSSVVQQTTTQTTKPATVVQQQSPPATVVQQQSPPATIIQQTGRHLLQVGTIEYISNNGSTGQPQLSVLDTVEGVPNISFKPTAVGQTASFNGALQVAVTTTNDGFGSPFIPYRVDSRLSPQCGVRVNFVAV